VIAEDLHTWRMEVGGLKKVEQLRATKAKIVVAPCANCKKQLRELIQFHKLDMELAGLHDVLGKALVFEKNP
jgi:Fe-S oxidoreductase